MPALDQATLATLQSRQDAIIEAWRASLEHTGHDGRASPRELEARAREFWRLLPPAAAAGDADGLQGEPWAEVRHFLEELSRERVLKGFSAAETATFIFSLKQPLFDAVEQANADAPRRMAAQLRGVSALLDQLGLYTVKVFQKNREDVIARQQEEMLELSTPVVKLWEGVLALPMIGTLDSQRTQVVMESLLQRIVETGSEIAIIDITHRGHPGGAAPAQDRHRDPPDGRRRHHQRRAPADRADHRAPGPGPAGHRHQGQPRRRPGAGAQAHRRDHGEGGLMERIPILQMGEVLLVTIQVDMHDQLALTLQDDLAERIRATSARDVLIEISALDIVDSFIGRMIATISALAAVMDARTVVVGMQPAVAITLVELGLDLTGVSTALTVERGMRLLRQAGAGDE